MSEVKTPRVTVSFECPQDLHTDQMIALHKAITNLSIFKDDITFIFENLNVDGNMREFCDQVDPAGILYGNYEDMIERKNLELIFDKSTFGACNDTNIEL